MSRMRRFLVMGSTACLALLSGCSANPPAEQVANFGRTLRGLGDASRLTPAEWATYQKDQAYLHGIARPDVRIRLNLADPAQYRFALARLKIAGKTPENSPYLFQAMEERHRDHLAQGFAPGLLPPERNDLAESAGRKEMHVIEAANAGETTRETDDGLGVATSTFPGGTFYTYTDTSYQDSAGKQLSQPTWAEEFDKGTNLTVPNSANLGLTRLGRYKVSSYKVDDSATGGFQDSYIYTEFGSPPGTTSTRPGLSALTVQAPVDTVLNDNLISVCLNRTWTGDCDYDLTGTPQAIKMPLKGQLSLTTAHVFDQAKINQFKADLNAGAVAYDVGHLKLILTNVGGGCDVTNGNLIEARMSQFWDRASLSADQKTFSWDLTGPYAAFFDDDCRQVQDEVKLTLKVVLPIVASVGGALYQSSVTLSNDPKVLRPDYTFKKITVTNSCLAAGTEIELAEGKVAPVESLKTGDRVSNPHKPTLTVMDTAIGVETVPMVRIRSESGRSLLMTEMHPIQVLARGMVQARALKTGDVVMTKTGPSKLVAVSREPYAGKVYNVKVGSDAEKLALAADQTVVFANGFVVGDGQIQQKYESIAMTKQNENVLATLPAKWHRDYQLAGKRK